MTNAIGRILAWKYDTATSEIPTDENGSLATVSIDVRDIESWNIRSVVKMRHYDEVTGATVEIEGVSMDIRTIDGSERTILADNRLINTMRTLGIDETPKN